RALCAGQNAVDELTIASGHLIGTEAFHTECWSATKTRQESQNERRAPTWNVAQTGETSATLASTSSRFTISSCAARNVEKSGPAGVKLASSPAAPPARTPPRLSLVPGTRRPAGFVRAGVVNVYASWTTIRSAVAPTVPRAPRTNVTSTPARPPSST